MYAYNDFGSDTIQLSVSVTGVYRVSAVGLNQDVAAKLLPLPRPITVTGNNIPYRTMPVLGIMV